MTAARDPALKKWRRFRSGPEDASSLMWKTDSLPGLILTAKPTLSTSSWLQAQTEPPGACQPTIGPTGYEPVAALDRHHHDPALTY